MAAARDLVFPTSSSSEVAAGSARAAASSSCGCSKPRSFNWFAIALSRPSSDVDARCSRPANVGRSAVALGGDRLQESRCDWTELLREVAGDCDGVVAGEMVFDLLRTGVGGALSSNGTQQVPVGLPRQQMYSRPPRAPSACPPACLPHPAAARPLALAVAVACAPQMTGHWLALPPRPPPAAACTSRRSRVRAEAPPWSVWAARWTAG